MAKEKIEIFSNKQTNMNDTRGLRSFIGKKVYTKLGHKLGRIKDVITKDGVITGIKVGKRFIDREYIESESTKAVMLTMDPVTKIIGKRVFDSEGKKIGKIISIHRKTNANNFTSLLVRKRLYSKPFTIPKEDISVFKENVILNKKY